MSRSVDDIYMFKDILQTRFKYKAEKNPLQEALKLVLNTFGSSIKNSFNTYQWYHIDFSFK